MSTTEVAFNPSAPSRQRRKAGRSRPAPAPRRWVVDVAAVGVGLGLGASVGLALSVTSGAQLSARGGVATFLGSLAGLAGTYLALVMLLLISRIPAVERVLGQDGLLRWHRRLAPWPLSLIAVHAVLLTIGYAQAARTGVWHELGSLMSVYPSMLAAVIAFALLVVIGVVSSRWIRHRVSRETWWRLHLGMYLVFALAFVHEVSLGPSFIGHPLTVAVWSLVWALTAGVVIAYRFGLPVVRSLRHRLEVVQVRPEAPGVVSVILKGRRLEELPVAGGQFLQWRFLVKGLWWQAHPFSLSARPEPPYLRLTVKQIGDFTARVAQLEPGTRVAIEGPYGAFTASARRRERVALIAGGIGVTAVRCLLDDLPRSAKPVVVLRATEANELALVAEIRELARRRDGDVQELIGAREDVPLARLALLIPDLAKRDIYVCGREGFVLAVVDFLRGLGLPADSIHHEVYAL